MRVRLEIASYEREDELLRKAAEAMGKDVYIHCQWIGRISNAWVHNGRVWAELDVDVQIGRK